MLTDEQAIERRAVPEGDSDNQATLPLATREHAGLRGELTNGQPWQPARMTEVLRRVSQLALTLANQIEQAGEVRPRRRWVIRRAPRRAPPALPKGGCRSPAIAATNARARQRRYRQRRRLIADWPTHGEMTVEQQRRLRGALDQFADLGDALRVACWIFPDGRAPVQIAAPDLRHWLIRHEAGRAVYIARRAPRPLSPR